MPVLSIKIWLIHFMEEQEMTTKRSWFGILSILTVFSLLLGACTAQPTATAEPSAPAVSETEAPAPETGVKAPADTKIALVQFLKGHPVHRLMQLGFSEACKAGGYQCELLLTDSTSPVDMIPLAEQALAEPVDGIVLYAVDDSFFPTIAKFNEAGIPVVTPHFTSFDQAASGLTAVVGADVVAYAKAAAEAMGAKLEGKGSVAVTVGSFNQTENLVAETFKATMAEKYPDITVLDPQEEGFDAAQAISKAVAIIQGNPDISGAFSTTGNGPTTWANAAAEVSSDIVIISMDYTRQNLDLVKEGKVYGLVAQPLYEEFYASVELVAKAINGQAIEYLNLLPAPVIMEADLESYYGFNDRAEALIDQ
jgi:ribose transport system substrate-binding protein